MVLRPTVREVVAQLAAGGELGPGAEEAVRTALGMSSEPAGDGATPWFVRVLQGVGAWAAALLFVGFLLMVRLVDSGGSAVAVGLLLAAAGTGLRLAGGAFLRQLALAATLCGEITFVIGVGLDSRETTTAAAALVLELAMLELYPDAVHRFLSTLACGLAAAVLVVKLAASPLGADAYVVAVGLAAGLAWTWLPRRGAARWAARQVPIACGLVVLLFAALAARLLAGMEHTDRELAGWIGGPFAAAGLSLGLLALEAAIFRELSLPPTHPAAVTAWLGTALLCAITFRTPGIAAALGVLALGFHRRRPLLVGLSIVFLIAFSGFFYYSLSATLLTKSAVLVGSGLVLLGVRFVLGHSTREAVEERP